MAKAADAVFLQSRMLNRGKGPAVHSLRVQADRVRYHCYLKSVLERQPGLTVKQGEIVDIRTDDTGAVCQVVTAMGAVYGVRAAIVATGTYLGGKIFVGEFSQESGPDGSHPAKALTQALLRLGLSLRRFKTGTPARVARSSIDFSRLEVQEGDEPVVPFSFQTRGPLQNRAVCHIAYTNSATHEVIRRNLHRSPLYGGEIVGVGPRYCPSIEDKVVRFADKERHQVFVEPMGADTEEMYLQGLSSSLPEEVQVAMYRTIQGLEQVEIMRTAYAIEYDCVDPLQLSPTLECKTVPGLYGAGQFNGTSGYEEAAAQGLVAGINAARQVQGKEPVVLERSGSYIGTLIDDLVTKGCMDPYRMMTSRSEYRLLLRQDNADTRLTPLGREIGLVDDSRWETFCRQQEEKTRELARLRGLTLSPSPALNGMLEAKGTAPLQTGIRAAELLKRPQIAYGDLAPFDPGRPPLDPHAAEQVEIEIKYEGYIKKQEAQVQQLRRMEAVRLPEGLDYRQVRGLRLEAAEKLAKIRPVSLGQASRISGVSPADLSVLVIYLEQRRKTNHD